MVAASGGDGMPETMFAAMACTPEGHLYIFGGLAVNACHLKITRLFADTTYQEVVCTWMATNALHFTQLAGKHSEPNVSMARKSASAGAVRAAPGPRSGHSMIHLPASMPQLNMTHGALLLFGGSDINTTNALEVIRTASAGKSDAVAMLNASKWDSTTWLYDIAADTWNILTTTGERPPGLVYHSMAVEGQQVR
jgi:hypothetical protein